MPPVRVRVMLGDLHLAFEGTEAFYAEHIEPLVEAAVPSPAAVVPPVEAPAVEPAAPDGFVPASAQFSSFVQRVGPRAAKPDQQVMAFAFYLWNYERKESFGSEEVTGCFKALGLPVPEPLGDRLTTLCERKRFLEPQGAADAYALTPKGVNYVKNRLLASA